MKRSASSTRGNPPTRRVRRRALGRCTRARISILALAGSVTGCGGESEPPPGDPVLAQVQQLFTARCAGTACHIGAATLPAGDLDLSPDALCAELIDVPAVEDPGQARVRPGASAESYLLCKLLPDCDQRVDGSTLMPPGSTGLPEAERALVAMWIDSGAPGCAGPDAQAPRFDGARTATGLSSAIRLTWEPASDDVSPAGELVYAIYEATRAGAQDFGQPTLVTAPGAAEAVKGGLPRSSAFFYVVRARDAAGNEDGNTVEVMATTLDTGDELPPVFAGVATAAPVGASSMRVSWQPASDDITPPADIVYRLYVADAPGTQDFGAPVVTTPAGASEALITELAADTTYYIVARAVDAAGNEDGNTSELAASTGSAVGFSSQVQPILTESCTGSGCHGGRMPAEGLDLTAVNAYDALVGVAATQCSERQRVAPGKPGSSYLINKLLGMDLCSGTRMPKGSPLGQAEIQIIMDWIAAGAVDD